MGNGSLDATTTLSQGFIMVIDQRTNGTTGRRALPVPQARARVMCLALGACFCAPAAWADTFAVVNGVATANQNGSVLTIANSNGAILEWDKFGIAVGNTVRFDQSSASSSVLNRVLAGGGLSAIYGTLSSNGRVFLINPAGIMIGQGGRVDTAGFVASTLAMRNSDFLAGKLTFGNAGEIGGDVINKGTIITPTGGTVYLIGSNVANEGIINTPKGEVILAAGQTVSLIDTSTPGIKVDIVGSEGNTTNLGEIAAEAGRIGMAGVIVKNSGIINASSAVEAGGRIFLKASQDSYVDKKASITATGTKGGSVEVLGNRVAVMDQAAIDVSGVGAGGTALIGGDYQGKNPEVQNSQITWFGPEASIKADATDKGNGGKVIVWADDTTRAYGSISARGGANGGDGGFVETSGHRYLDVGDIKVSTTAPKGEHGTWLLDPTDITIVDSGGTDTNITTGTPFQASPASSSTSTLKNTTINTALSGGNVVITTSSSGGGIGDIVFDSTGGAISISNASSGRTLTLNADNDIKFVGANPTYFQTTATGATLDVEFNPGAGKKVDFGSGSTVYFNANSAPDYVAAKMTGASGKTWQNAGTVWLNGGAYIDLGSSGISSTFNNAGSGIVYVNVAGSTTDVIRDSSGAGGTFNNSGGILNVQTSAGTAIVGAAFNQTGGGASLSSDGTTLKFDKALSLAGGAINLKPGGAAASMWVQGNSAAAFNNVLFSGTGGTLYVSGPSASASFAGVTANNTALNIGSGGGPGTVNILGNTTFSSVTINSGTLASMSNGILGITGGGFVVPAGVTYTGNVGFLATGNLTVNAGPITSTGSVKLIAGWDGASVSTPVVVSGVGTISGTSYVSSPNLTLTAGSSISMTGNNLADHVVASTASGSINYNSAASTVHIDSATAVGGSVTLTSTASNAIALGTVSGSNVTVTAGGAILDDNAGAVNITSSGSISLTSTNGGSSGGLAISTDTFMIGAPTVSATVSAGSYGGIEVRNQSGTPYSVNLTDNATSGTSAHFHSAANFSTALTGGLTLDAGSGVARVSSDGTLTYNGLGGGSVVAGDIGLQSAGALTISNGLSSSANISLASNTTLDVNIGVASTAGDVLLIGNTININSSGLVSAATGDIGMLAFDALTINGSVTAGNDALLVGGNSVNINAAVSGDGVGVIGGIPSFVYSSLVDIPSQTTLLSGAVVVGNGGSVVSTVDAVGLLARDILIANGGYVSSANNVYLGARDDIGLINGGRVIAANDVYLALFSGDSKLYLNNLATGQLPSYVWAQSPDTIHIAFPLLGSGGIVIDGVETSATTGASGFFTGPAVGGVKVAAAEGRGLKVSYGNTRLDAAIARILSSTTDDSTDLNTNTGGGLPGFDKDAVLADGGPTAGGGDGEFGGKEDDKDKNGDKGDDKGKRPDDKSGKKPAAQCKG